MRKTLIFAYGSNMKTDIMRGCVPSTIVIGKAKLLNKRMLCNKMSYDGSTKANLADSQSDIVWGVLYKINSLELPLLDRKEKNYKRKLLQMFSEQSEPIEAETYISTNLTTDLPYEWYKKTILEGAIEHNLPKDYIEYLFKLPSKPDLRKKEGT